jgi:hypothetical protein
MNDNANEWRMSDNEYSSMKMKNNYDIRRGSDEEMMKDEEK